MSPSRLVRIAVPLAAAALLAGCSGAATPGGGTGPGVALRAGDATVDVKEVDRAADGICRTLEPRLEQQGQALPKSDIRQYVVRVLASRLQLDQWAESEGGLEPGPAYEAQRAELETVAESMPADLRDDFVEVESTQAYARDLLTRAGRTVLEVDGTAAPTDEAAFEAGAQAFQEWAADHADDLHLDPRFGIVLRDGSFVAEETGTSVAVSDAAVQGAAEEADPTYAARLPESQRCG